MLTAAIDSWHWLCGKRLSQHESEFSTTIQYDYLGIIWTQGIK